MAESDFNDESPRDLDGPSTDPLLADEMVRRFQLTTWATGLLALVVAFATVVRPLISTHHSYFTVVGSINTVTLTVLWWVFRSGRLKRQAPLLLFTFATIVALPLILTSGGPNSQFASLVPLFPIFGVLIGGGRLAIGTFLFWVVVLPLMLALGGVLPDLTDEVWDVNKAASRTFWLILSSLMALAFAIQFDRRARSLQQRLLELAERDPLTGIGNRRFLEASLTRQLALSRRHNRSFALMMIDVDHFKRFNDQRGHGDGDEALKGIARVLIAETRQGQDTVARFGGEEFTLLLGETDSPAASAVAEKIRGSVRSLGLKYSATETDVLTVTIGYASVSGDGRISRDELFRRADAALYHGKTHGRDQAVDAASLREPLLDPASTQR